MFSNVNIAVGRAAVVLLAALAGAVGAQGLDCGDFTFPNCHGPAAQFDAGFRPGADNLAFGGFGGKRDCVVRKTPVIFIHGNADSAIGWDSPGSAVRDESSGRDYTPPASVYDSFIAHGYQPCELFGLTYLSPAEQKSPQNNRHQPGKYALIKHFIDAVKAYTGASQVDLVTHSLGVTMTLAGLDYYDERGRDGGNWRGVRRFVNIAGALRGLGSCVGPGYLYTTCKAEAAGDAWTFGFYADPPMQWFLFNRWTAAGGLRDAPTRHPAVRFYTITAGAHDEINCSAVPGLQDCRSGPLFTAAPNVLAQLDIGAGATASQVDLDFNDMSPLVVWGGDAGAAGIGHYKARNQAGEILVRMLMEQDCEGIACVGDYRGGPARAVVERAGLAVALPR